MKRRHQKNVGRKRTAKLKIMTAKFQNCQQRNVLNKNRLLKRWSPKWRERNSETKMGREKWGEENSKREMSTEEWQERSVEMKTMKAKQQVCKWYCNRIAPSKCNNTDLMTKTTKTN